MQRRIGISIGFYVAAVEERNSIAKVTQLSILYPINCFSLAFNFFYHNDYCTTSDTWMTLRQKDSESATAWELLGQAIGIASATAWELLGRAIGIVSATAWELLGQAIVNHKPPSHT